MTARAPLRLYCDSPLSAGIEVALSPEITHYVRTVMRRGSGDELLLFNARDGEWRASLLPGNRLAAVALTGDRVRKPAIEPGPVLLFAPIKRGPTEFLIEKATELGVAAFRPVITARTRSDRLRLDRLLAIAREAAEQCGRLSLPDIAPPVALDRALAALPPDLPLYFCDERRDAPGLLATALDAPRRSAALLIGPEGGFTPFEADLISGSGSVRAVSLGPRILRAETAGIAALTILRAVDEQMPASLH